MRPKLEQGFIPSSQMCVTDNGPYNNQNCEGLLSDTSNYHQWTSLHPNVVSTPTNYRQWTRNNQHALTGPIVSDKNSMEDPCRLRSRICHVIFSCTCGGCFGAGVSAVTTSQIDEEAYLPSLLSNIFTNETEWHVRFVPYCARIIMLQTSLKRINFEGKKIELKCICKCPCKM